MSRVLIFSGITLLAFLAFACWPLDAVVQGQVCPHRVDEVVDVVPCDQICLISARDFDCRPCPSTDCLHCQCYCEGQWLESSCCGISAGNGNQEQQTVVYVHGYQTDLEDAQKRGLQVYENLFGECRSTPPIRFVVWCWKSERESKRPIHDFNAKARLASGLGDIFALTLNELGPKPPIVIGYSLGAQVVVSATVQSSLYCGSPIQFAVIAAANNCEFASCCHHLVNCGQIARTYVFLNDDDRAIRAANAICRIRYGRQYNTFEELAANHSGQMGRVNIIDISNVASRRHSIVKYTSIPIVRSCIRQLVQESTACNHVHAEEHVVHPLGQGADPIPKN